MSPKEQAEGELKNIGRLIKSILPDGWGFAFLAFPFGPGGELIYLANAAREDVVATMYEFIEATKDSYGQHKPDDDTEVARLRQRVAILERELEKARYDPT